MLPMNVPRKFGYKLEKFTITIYHISFSHFLQILTNFAYLITYVRTTKLFIIDQSRYSRIVSTYFAFRIPISQLNSSE